MSRERGFTLVELMIAMTLGLLIMTALVTLFVDTSRTNREMAKTNSQIENARFALQILEEDLCPRRLLGRICSAIRRPHVRRRAD